MATWVRAQDEFGTFDVLKGSPLYDNWSLVKPADEYEGPWGRPAAAHEKAVKADDSKKSDSK